MLFKLRGCWVDDWWREKVEDWLVHNFFQNFLVTYFFDSFQDVSSCGSLLLWFKVLDLNLVTAWLHSSTLTSHWLQQMIVDHRVILLLLTLLLDAVKVDIIRSRKKRWKLRERNFLAHRWKEGMESDVESKCAPSSKKLLTLWFKVFEDQFSLSHPLIHSSFRLAVNWTPCCFSDLKWWWLSWMHRFHKMREERKEGNWDEF